MNITANLKPTVIKASTHAELMDKVTKNHCRSVGTSYGSGWTKLGRRDGNETVRVMNLHKVRAKYKQERHKKDNPEKGYVKGQTNKSVLVREAHWVAYVYDISIELLKCTKLHVRQNARNWDIGSPKSLQSRYK